MKFKISNFCHVEPSQVINIQDLASIYHVPLEMVRQNIVAILTERLQLSLAAPIRPRKFMLRWRQLANRQENVRKVVNIALVGKYTQLEDAYASVIKASVSWKRQFCRNNLSVFSCNCSVADPGSLSLVRIFAILDPHQII